MAARTVKASTVVSMRTLTATGRPSGARASSPFRPAKATPRPTTAPPQANTRRSDEHTSELQSLRHLVCRLLLEKKKKNEKTPRKYIPPVRVVSRHGSGRQR